MIKKGQTSIIITVLLVLISIAAIILISNFIIIQVKNSIAEAELNSKDFQIYVKGAEIQDGFLKLTLSRHSSNENFTGLKIVMVSEDKSQNFFYNGSIDSIETKDIFIPLMSGLIYSKNIVIDVYPIVFINGVEKIAHSATNIKAALESNSLDNLVGYWPLDGNYLDVTGKNNGTAHNGVDNVAGISGGAMNFDGLDDYMETSDTNFPVGSNTRTISAWVYPKSYAFLLHIVHYGSASAGCSWGLVLQDSKLAAHEWGYYDAVGTVPLNQWTQVAIVLDSNGNKIQYVNGVNVGNLTLIPNTISSGIFRIGSRTNTPAEFFNGYIDEVRVYDRALSGQEVKSLYDVFK